MNKNIGKHALYVGLSLMVLFGLIYYKFHNIYNKMLEVFNTKEGFQQNSDVRREMTRLWQRHIKIPTESPRTTNTA